MKTLFVRIAITGRHRASIRRLFNDLVNVMSTFAWNSV